MGGVLVKMTKRKRKFLMGEGLVLLFSFTAIIFSFFIQDQRIKFGLIVSSVSAFVITLVRIIIWRKGSEQ
jgi:hypothetical protein